MADDRLSSSLQESLLTAIMFHDGIVAEAAAIITADLFDEPYRELADRVLEFRARYKKAPGKAHIDDIFDFLLESKDQRRARLFQGILSSMVAISDGLNLEYVVSRTVEFVRRQTLKAGVLEAAQRYQAGGDGLIGDVEKILFNALRTKADALDSGVRLGAPAALNFLSDSTEPLFKLNIPSLDKHDLGPARKELSLLMAARGKGKSMWLVHLGKQALLQRCRIVHITLEMSEERAIQRYFQTLFSVSKRPEEWKSIEFESDDLGRLIDMHVRTNRARLDLKDPEIQRFLRDKQNEFGRKLDNLVVKQFPTGKLTVDRLEGFLDMLYTTFRFEPDLLLVDYPDLMALDPKNLRLETGIVYQRLRGIGVERNIAVAAVTQGNRDSEDARNVKGSQTAEDISKLAIADNFFTYSQTVDEYVLGLARLYVEKCRNDEGKMTVLISQAYKTAQFVTDSIRFRPEYWDLLKNAQGRELQEQPPAD